MYHITLDTTYYIAFDDLTIESNNIIKMTCHINTIESNNIH